MAAPQPPDLTRADLIAAAATVADRYVRGAPYPADVAMLVGRAFSVRLPFGCQDALSDSVPAEVRVDAARKRMTIEVSPQAWTGAGWLRDIVGDAKSVEDIEGFWIHRPWTTSDRCPMQMAPPAPDPGAPPEGQTGPASRTRPAPDLPSPADEASPLPAPETLGLMQIYRRSDPRLNRHARAPYRVVRKLDDGAAPRTFWLVLDGRLAAFGADPPMDRPARCTGDSPDRRPVCLFAVDIQRIRIEDQETGETLADWPR